MSRIKHLKRLNSHHRECIGLPPADLKRMDQIAKNIGGYDILLREIYSESAAGKLSRILREEKAQTVDIETEARRVAKRERISAKGKERRLERERFAQAAIIQKVKATRGLTKRIGTPLNGFVYAISNPVWPGWLKIGSALIVEERLAQFNTGDPYASYKLEFFTHSNDRVACERAIHSAFSQCRGKGEWFQITVDSVRHAIYAFHRAAEIGSTKKVEPNC